jgi:hypothetical protein
MSVMNPHVPDLDARVHFCLRLVPEHFVIEFARRALFAQGSVCDSINAIETDFLALRIFTQTAHS